MDIKTKSSSDDDAYTETTSDLLIPKELSFLPNSALQCPAPLGVDASLNGKRALFLESNNDISKKTRLAPSLIQTSSEKPAELLEDVKRAINIVETQTGEEMDVAPSMMTVSLMPHQRLSLCWMVKQEQDGFLHGGILADDQGLGKLITMIALILTHKPTHSMLDFGFDDGKEMSKHRQWMQRLVENAPNWKQNTGGTLVICPAVVLSQWESEINEKVTSNCGISVLRYHGKSKIKNVNEIAQYSIVLTTYATLTKEIGKFQLDGDTSTTESLLESSDLPQEESGDAPGLISEKSDEAQCIKNPRSYGSKAVAALSGDNRWCLSGTPIMNSVYDLFPLFRFLKYSPYHDFSNFKSLIAKPIAKSGARGFDRLRTILKGVLLRRTKNSKIDGHPIVQLPDKELNLIKTNLSEKEFEFYEKIQSEIKSELTTLAAKPRSEYYISSLMLILKLRQASSHPWLLKKSPPIQEKSVPDQLNRALKIPKAKREEMIRRFVQLSSVCPFCGDVPDVPVVSVHCEHVFCNQCTAFEINTRVDQEEQTIFCPECKASLNATEFFTEQVLREANGEVQDQGDLQHEWVSSAKLDKLMEILEGIRSGSKAARCDSGKVKTNRCVSDQLLTHAFSKIPNHRLKMIPHQEMDKVLVFSQWTRMLDLIEIPLKKSDFQFRRIDGKMTVQQRERAIFEFKSVKEIMVLLISLKSASLGINLSCANHVIIMDLWWNPTVEDQAIDRAHRIGQMRNVRVTRITVKDTVDEGILKLQERKRSIVDNAFGGVGGDVHVSGRLTLEDIQFLFRFGKLTTE
eukprot:g198.t1